MATFEISFRAYQTVTIEAKSIEEAERNAIDHIKDEEWEPVEMIGADIVDAEDGEIEASIEGKACAKCSHYHIENHMCEIEGVPESKTPFWNCCLFTAKTEGGEQ